MALAGTWPSARREAATVAMFCMVTLVVARKVFCSVDVFANVLAFRASHDLLIPSDESIVPVTLGVEVDILTVAILLCCRCGCCCRCCCGRCCRCCCRRSEYSTLMAMGSYHGRSYVM